MMLFSAIIYFLLSACSASERNKDQKLSTGIFPSVDTGNTPVIIPSKGGIVRLNVINGQGKTDIQKKKDQTIKLEFESKGYKNISAKLFSNDSLANIRFSQIILPNGNSDGPFGMSMNYRIYSDGIYRLLINENIMAGNPWGGVFEVEVSLTH